MNSSRNITAASDLLLSLLVDAYANVLLGEKIPLDIFNYETGEVLIPAGRRINITLIKRIATAGKFAECDPSPVRNKLREIYAKWDANKYNEATKVLIFMEQDERQQLDAIKEASQF